jgi:quinol-cytochrome oxidoreductase complex cytochrome b subunit
VLHIWALHEAGQNNPAGVDPKSEKDTVPFTPHATMKDMFATSLFLILFAVFIFYMPDALGHADNYIPANPLQTPPEIVPEWYLLPFYAILRAIDFNVGPIDSKLGGVILMFGSIAVLFVLPWLDTSSVRSMRYRPIARQFFFIFVLVCLALGWCGGQNPGKVLVSGGQSRATLTWVEGGSRLERRVDAAGASQFEEAADAMRAEMRQQGATMTFIQRENATEASAVGIVGGEPETRTLSAATPEALEEEVQELKEEVGQRAVFFEVRRELPFAFTITMFSQLLTAYYFLFFLAILPILGLRETPGRVPDTIAKPVLSGQGA